MKELVGRMMALDPRAGEELRLIAYFDALVDAKAGTETLLREAARLSGATTGHADRDAVLRLLPSGDIASGDPPDATSRFPTASVGEEGLVWQETSGARDLHADLVLERVALAIEIARRNGHERSSTQIAIETLLGPPLPGESGDTRVAAAGFLRLESAGAFRAVALPVDERPPSGWPQALVRTTTGPLRAVIVRDGFRATSIAGVGVAMTPASLHHSWRSATLALRLADGATFVADELGLLLDPLLAISAAPALHPDLAAVADALAHGWSRGDLRSLANGRSLRGIASDAGVHHSTVQGRIPSLVNRLGFDPVSPIGRTRLSLALLALPLVETTDAPTSITPVA